MMMQLKRGARLHQHHHVGIFQYSLSPASLPALFLGIWC